MTKLAHTRATVEDYLKAFAAKNPGDLPSLMQIKRACCCGYTQAGRERQAWCELPGNEAYLRVLEARREQSGRRGGAG